MIKNNDTIAVWFSCGAASAIAAKETIKKYGDIATIRVINNPIKEEHPDNRRFLKEVEEWLNIKVEFAINSKYKSCSCVDVWDKQKYMSSIYGAPCTKELKKNARKEWEKNNKADWHVLGFTWEEKNRSEKFIEREKSNLLPVLIDACITKGDCYRLISEAGIELPEMYKLGYPNANCIGCVKASSPTYWNHVRKIHPKVFDARAKQSRKIGAKLVRVKNERTYLDKLKLTDTGKPLKDMRSECGIFCEERY